MKRITQNNKELRPFRARLIIPTLCVLGALSAPGHAQDIQVTINGRPVAFKDIGPQQIEGRTLVPVRGVLEQLGASIAYDNRTSTVTASTATIDIQLRVGSRTAIVNTREVPLDVPAQSIRDHVFVPLRFIGEALGARLRWDGESRTVRITTNDNPDERSGGEGRPRRPRSDDEPRRPREQGGPAPQIDSFRISGGKWLHAGETVHAVLRGTPGAEAAFRIPGLTDEIPMHEVEPGHYEGDWQAPNGKAMQLRSGAAIGELRKGDRAAPMLQAADSLSVDTAAPEVQDVTPDKDARVMDSRPLVSAVFRDSGSGIDKDAVRLLVNGRDVTSRAEITRAFISYRPVTPLDAGRVDVELRLADIAGNRTVARWSFDQQRRTQGGIVSVADDFNHTLAPGDVLHVEANASPGGQMTFTAGTIQNAPMREDRPGHYVGAYTLRRGDDTGGKPIAYRLVMPGGEKYSQASRSAVKTRQAPPDAPIILVPGASDPPTNPLVVRGKGTPNSQVHLVVRYDNRVLGVFSLRGVLADTTVTTDRNGVWQSEPISVNGLYSNRGVEYSIEATGQNASGDKSDTTSTKFRFR